MEKDINLKGNDKIEESLRTLKKDLTDENLTRTLSLIRKRMKKNGHLVVAVKTSASGNVELRTLKTSDGKQWFAAFTSFEEQNRGGDNIKSGFTAEIEKIFDICLQTTDVEGIIINPWNLSIKLDKTLISIVKGI